MSPRETRTVILAVSILRRAVKARGEDPVRDDAIRLALRVLLPWVPADTLSVFWRITENKNPAQRGGLLKSQLALIEAAIAHARGVS